MKRKLVKPKRNKRKVLSKTSLCSYTNLAERFKDTVEPAQLDLLVDLDEEFFQSAYLLVQSLSSRSAFVAGKIKRYVDILIRLHARYASEVEEVNTLRLKVSTADEKLEQALRATSTSEAMMEKIRESLEEAWRNQDASLNREEIVQNQLRSVSVYHRIDSIPIPGKEGHIRNLVIRDRDRMAGELKDYEKRLSTHRIYSETLENMLQMAQETIANQQVRLKKTEFDYYKLERTTGLAVESGQEREQQLGKEVAALQHENLVLQHVQKDLAEMTVDNKAIKQRNERLSLDNYNLSKSLHMQEKKKKQLQLSLKRAEHLNNVQRRKYDDLELTLIHTERNAKKKANETMNLEQRFRQVAKKNSELISQALNDRNEILLLNKKITLLATNLEEMTNQKDEMARTLEKLRIEIARLTDTVAFVRHETYDVRNQKEAVQIELVQARKLLDMKSLEVQKIAREKHELFVELNDAEKRIGGLDEGLANKTERLEATQLLLQQKQQDFFNTKKQMEILHSDKVMLAKSLEMCSSDRATMQGTMAKLTHQINQQTALLSANDKEIKSLKNHIEQLGRVIRQKQNDIHAKGVLLTSTRSDLREMKLRVEQTQNTIYADDKRFKGMACALDEVKKEKTLVGLQMVRRNDELRLMREKLGMMQNAIDHGTRHYNQRLEDIRLLKLEVSNLRMSHMCMQKEVGIRAEIRQDVIRLERQLNQERLRASTYWEELSRPCRIHRWRVLLGKDPRRFDLICKVQSLLKLNLRQSVQRDNLAKQLAEAQKLHKDYKRLMERTANPQFHEKLFLQEAINRRQKRRIKAMTAELRINEIDLKARDLLILRFQEQLRLQQQESHSPPVQKAQPNDDQLVDKRFDSSHSSAPQ
ncbi:hypothetical protein KR038_007651 [Drosophila bunnanda]|nr:hypothetical protein KR038_007651 [Drosophila bunnanda]